MFWKELMNLHILDCGTKLHRWTYAILNESEQFLQEQGQSFVRIDVQADIQAVVREPLLLVAVQ